MLNWKNSHDSRELYLFWLKRTSTIPGDSDKNISQWTYDVVSIYNTTSYTSIFNP